MGGIIAILYKNGHCVVIDLQHPLFNMVLLFYFSGAYGNGAFLEKCYEWYVVREHG